MASVETVRGTVDLDELGTTLMHEHVFVLTPDVMQNHGHEWWDERERHDDAVRKLRELAQAGVDTIVDPTVIGLGRYIPRIQLINAEVDINIVVATGLYTFDEIPHFFHHRGPGTLLGGPELMTEMFVEDIREGIGETGVRAALLKCVVEERGLTPDQERVQRAVCETHQETGVPITVHTNSAHETGRIALDFYAAHGVDLTKVVVGHAGDSNDLDYLRSLMDRGATIGCDRFGLDLFNPTEQRVATIATLCEQGYADRIVLSHDAACYMDYFSGADAQQALAAAAPNWHYLHISREVLPALRERGVTEGQIRTIVALAQGVKPARVVSEFAGTLKTLRYAFLTVASVLALAYVMNLSGQTQTLGTWIAGTGALFAFLSPTLGWLGTAVTGSDTSANALFATLQQTAAQKTGIDPTLLVAANTSGGVVGKMISPQNLTIAATAVGLHGKESDIFRRVVGWSVGLLIVLCLLVGLQSTVLSWMV
ncbi:L-lactate permease [Pseudonocardia sp. C8]|uniref:phosphotriesterase family protein n=1 Tax=Pseudonocardia sp. C8 TaxID=2762759 RepID=UPI0016435003|nr:L-lactate permease [Pseudonocardia sp. C8]MBC3193897.1 L-lactate permease [Pseudonocardia sp. C8]